METFAIAVFHLPSFGLNVERVSRLTVRFVPPGVSP